MGRKVKSPSEESKDILRALRRAARKALELGVQTGTPVYVMKDGKIVDLTKDKAATEKIRAKLIKKLMKGR
jgi:tryptophan synthase alpha subunit